MSATSTGSSPPFWQRLILTLISSGAVAALIAQITLLRPNLDFEGREDALMVAILAGNTFSSLTTQLKFETGAARVLLLLAKHPPDISEASVSIFDEATVIPVSRAETWNEREVDDPYLEIISDVRDGTQLLITERLAEGSDLRIIYETDGIVNSIVVPVRTTGTTTWYLSLNFDKELDIRELRRNRLEGFNTSQRIEDILTELLGD